MMWLVLACTWGSGAESGGPGSSHVTGWADLQAAVAAGDVEAAHGLARGVDLGDIPSTSRGDGSAETALAAALGFLQVAESPEELVLGLDRAQAACDACHRAAAGP